MRHIEKNWFTCKGNINKSSFFVCRVTTSQQIKSFLIKNIEFRFHPLRWRFNSMSVNLSPNIVWEIRRGGISTSDTTYENDGECLRH